MLPNFCNQQSPAPPELHHSPKKTNTFFIRKSPFNSIKSQSTVHLISWIIVIAVLFHVMIIVFLLRDSTEAPTPLPTQSFEDFKDNECENGRVYVHDLPPIFNKELLDDRHDLEPWKSWGEAVSNGGLGPKATNLIGVVPEDIIPAWYWSDKYGAEIIYHVRMLNYKCRTLNPQQATAFYVPFYATLALGKYLTQNYTAKDRDRHSELVLDWLKDEPFWKRQNGADHFIMLGRLSWDFRRETNNDSDWGSSFFYMPLMKNVLKITVEKFPWDELDFSVPYPIAFHPRSESDIVEWQRYIRERKRHSLFTFVGATHVWVNNDFRGLLIDYCKVQSGSCKLVDCSVTECLDGAPVILEAFLDSDFCLQPRGEGYTRRSIFECMLSGSIPVYFWEKSFKGQYVWHLPLKPETYSVFIDRKVVRNGTVSIKRILEGYSKDEVRKMRETLIDLLPRILYAESRNGLDSTKDAFDITIEKVLRKIHHRSEFQDEAIFAMKQELE